MKILDRHYWAAGFMRYRLSNGWFIDGARLAGMYYGGWKYSIWEPGASPEGHAAFRGGASTLRAAIAKIEGKG